MLRSIDFEYCCAQDSVHRFETVAGRAAMMGFVAAALAEFVLPAHGLFGGWSGEQLSAFSTVALVGVTCAALLAMASKKKVGARLTEVRSKFRHSSFSHPTISLRQTNSVS